MKVKIESPIGRMSGTYKNSGLVYYEMNDQVIARGRPEKDGKPVVSEPQVKIQSAMKNLSREWSKLTDAQRTAWSAYARRFFARDDYNQPVSTTGLSIYVGANMVRTYLGLGSSPEAPVEPPPLRLRSVGDGTPQAGSGLPADTLAILIEHDYAASAMDGFSVLVRTTPALPSIACKPRPGDYRYVCNLTPASAQPLAESGSVLLYTPMSRPVTAGKSFGVEARIVRTTDGIMSRPTYAVLTRPT